MKKSRPFFAKFLESQLSDKSKKEVKGGDPITSPVCDLLEPSATTQKYPSDAEDGGIYTLPNDLSDVDGPSMTLKYPSDLEDH